jgi:3-isopropylmalate/(R)-2-methylmalate dehydratase large subunit
MAASLFDKVWEPHVVARRGDGEVLLYIDRQILHEGSGGSFPVLAQRGLKVRRPDRTFAMADHFVPTTSRDEADASPERRRSIAALRANAAREGFSLFDLGDPRQGIVHVVGPEQGLSQPGMTIVCGDSHTATHGAMGALAFGIGTTEVAHVLATQTLWQAKPRQMRITVDGQLGPGVFAKDLILAVIAQIGAAGASGHAVEYAGEAIRALSMEGRLTVCNMSIEAGARCGMIAPDDTTFAYLAGRPHAPAGADWDAALGRWRSLFTDPDAVFDKEIRLDAGGMAPMATWGVSPEDALAIDGRIPDPADTDPVRRAAIERALDYMGLTAGAPIAGTRFDRVFIGSCTNGRIEDLRAAAAIVRGRKAQIPAMISPGSTAVRAQAQVEGLDRIFAEAGFEWRHAGCSMCVGMNGDVVEAGQRCASTTNRNFIGRQGKGARTHLMSPAMAAAVAVIGVLTDVRELAVS